MSRRFVPSGSMVKNTLEYYFYFALYYSSKAIVFLGSSVIQVIILPFIFVKRVIQNVIAFENQNGASIRRSLIESIILLPQKLVGIVQQIISLLESAFLGVIRMISGIYRFLTSTYFRYFVYGFLFCLLYLFFQQAYIFVTNLPSPAAIGEVNFAQSTHLYDRNGKLLYEIFRDQNRTPIPLDQMPEAVIQATIAIEDKNFYNHKGISFFGGILRAAKDTYLTKELQGGSTLTQQLVKTALLTPERTIERKLKEMVLALWTEQMYTKDQIMEMYLNQVPYGGSAYGIEEASQVYFGKSAQDLTLSEAALLAGLPRAPSIYSPFIDPDLAKRRRDQVLDAMHSQGYINDDEFETAITEELVTLPPTTNIRAPHFVMFTRSSLENEYGTKQIEEEGFEVITSIDLGIQEVVEDILAEEVEKLTPLGATNGAVIVMDPHTGQILAMAGSVDYFREGYGAFNVTTALRQPGSTLKPMLYSLALQNGYTAATTIQDAPVVFGIPGGRPYQPFNYDRRYHGNVPIRYALGNSYNIPAVKVLNTLGVQNFVDYAKRMGIDSWEDSSRFGLSLSLGGGEVSLIDLTQVYSVFANGGYRVEPTPFLHIRDDTGRDVARAGGRKVRVIDSGIAFIMSDILSDNIARTQAFGSNNPLYIPGEVVAAKTGTTNDYKDAWTIGFTEKVVVGVWVGNNNNRPMHSIAGSLGAGPIFNRIMSYMIEQHDAAGKMEQPADVVAVPCYNGRIEYFLRGTENQSACRKTIIEPAQPQGVQEVRNITQE